MITHIYPGVGRAAAPALGPFLLLLPQPQGCRQTASSRSPGSPGSQPSDLLCKTTISTFLQLRSLDFTNLRLVADKSLLKQLYSNFATACTNLEQVLLIILIYLLIGFYFSSRWDKVSTSYLS